MYITADDLDKLEDQGLATEQFGWMHLDRDYTATGRTNGRLSGIPWKQVRPTLLHRVRANCLQDAAPEMSPTSAKNAGETFD